MFKEEVCLQICIINSSTSLFILAVTFSQFMVPLSGFSSDV